MTEQNVGRYAEVRWHDAHGGQTEWQPLTALVARVNAPKVVVSVGQIIADDETGILLVGSVDLDGMNVDGYMYIPRVCVIRFRLLGEAS